MPAGKSLLHYGWVYHLLFDPPLAEARRVVVEIVPEGSFVLDVGCGTGKLCFALRREKHCRVVGIDLSRRMLDFAVKSNRHDGVEFAHQDATDLAGLGPQTFDYATALFLIHELPRDGQLRVLSEALRVARNLVIVDSKAPLPRSLHGVALRIVEATVGREHNGHFKSFLSGGGIMGALNDSRLPLSVVHRSVFWHNCREVVVVSRQDRDTASAGRA